MVVNTTSTMVGSERTCFSSQILSMTNSTQLPPPTPHYRTCKCACDCCLATGSHINIMVMYHLSLAPHTFNWNGIATLGWRQHVIPGMLECWGDQLVANDPITKLKSAHSVLYGFWGSAGHLFNGYPSNNGLLLQPSVRSLTLITSGLIVPLSSPYNVHTPALFDQ